MAASSTFGFTFTTSMLLGILPLLLFLVVYGYSQWLYSHRKGNSKVPGGPPLVLPIVGETVQMFMSNPDTFFNERHQKYGSMYTTHLFGQPTIAASSPDALKFFLSSKSFHLSQTSTFKKVIGSEAITQLQGNLHSKVRKIILSAVAADVLKSFIGTMDEIVQRDLKAFEEGVSVNAMEEMKTVTFHISSSLVCDHLTGDNPRTQELRRLLHYVEEGLFCLEIDLPGTTFRKAMQARAAAMSLLDEVISLRRKQGGHHNDILQMFLDSEGKLTDAHIRDNLLTVIFASHDTSALTLTWLLKMLSESPDLLQQVQDEHDAIARRKGPGELLTVADLKDMQLSARVIQETLRIANIVHFTLREAQEDVDYNGYFIPKGWKVLINLRYLHVGPDNYPAPFAFDPSRFQAQPKPGTFLPFGGGIRLCPGNELARQEILVFMHRFFTTYSYKAAGPDLGIKYYPMPVPKGGFPMILTRRNVHSQTR